ncbi:MAG: DUF4093 domain-containing protein, partial [Anaerovoracaceae bacterium]
TKLTEKFPKAKQAYLDRYDAKKGNDIGIENARPEAICKALAAARGIEIVVEPLFTMEDLQENGLCGGSDAAERRRAVGKHLGIGYGNSKGFLKKLNQYRITKEEFNEAILTKYHQGHQK